MIQQQRFFATRNSVIFGLLMLAAESSSAAGFESVQKVRSIETEHGFRIYFSRPVLTGTYAVPPFQRWVLPSSRDVQILAVRHRSFSQNEISVSFTPDSYGSGQPYDPEASDYNASLRLSFPYTLQSSEAPRTLHFARMDYARKAASSVPNFVYPFLDPVQGDFVTLVERQPPIDALTPAGLGPSWFKALPLSAYDILNNFDRFTAQLPIPTPSRTLTEVLPELCRAVHSISGYQNLSYGQYYVVHPLGAPNQAGHYATTYGSSRSAAIADYLLALLDPNPDPWQRKVGLACFIQNIALNYLGAALSNFPTNEGGGHGGGILISSLVAAMLLQHPMLTDRLQTAMSNQRFAEQTLLYRSPVDNHVYYGGGFYNPMDYARCATGSALHWGQGNMTYCVMRDGDPALNRVDFGRGGGYQQIGTGMFLITAFMMMQVPELATLAGDAAVVEYVQRYLQQGVLVWKPEIDGLLRSRYLEAIAENNILFPAQAISSSRADEVINDLISRNGFFGMSHHHEIVYQWLLGHWEIQR